MLYEVNRWTGFVKKLGHCVSRRRESLRPIVVDIVRAIRSSGYVRCVVCDDSLEGNGLRAEQPGGSAKAGGPTQHLSSPRPLEYVWVLDLLVWGARRGLAAHEGILLVTIGLVVVL